MTRLPRISHPILLWGMIATAIVLWLVCVGSLQRDELILGIGVLIATFSFSIFVFRIETFDVTIRPTDLLQAWRIPWYILTGVAEITLILGKDLVGLSPAKSLYRVCGFDTSTRDPVRRARTILAIAYTTVAPNFIVIGIDAAQSRMLFHQIDRSSVPRMTKSLGAKS